MLVTCVYNALSFNITAALVCVNQQWYWHVFYGTFLIFVILFTRQHNWTRGNPPHHNETQGVIRVWSHLIRAQDSRTCGLLKCTWLRSHISTKFCPQVMCLPNSHLDTTQKDITKHMHPHAEFIKQCIEIYLHEVTFILSGLSIDTNRLH